MHCSTLALLTSLLLPLFAQDTQKPKTPDEPAKSTLRPLELLASEIGTWDAKVRSWPGPNVTPNVTKAVERNRMLGKSAWLISDLEGSVLGRPYEGHRVVGYDAKKKRFVGTWINTLSPGIVTLEGSWDAKQRTRTMWLDMRHPMTRTPCRAKLTTKYVSKTRRVVTLEAPVPKVKPDTFYRVLELDLKRRL